MRREKAEDFITYRAHTHNLSAMHETVANVPLTLIMNHLPHKGCSWLLEFFPFHSRLSSPKLIKTTWRPACEPHESAKSPAMTRIQASTLQLLNKSWKFLFSVDFPTWHRNCVSGITQNSEEKRLRLENQIQLFFLILISFPLSTLDKTKKSLRVEPCRGIAMDKHQLWLLRCWQWRN